MLQEKIWPHSGESILLSEEEIIIPSLVCGPDDLPELIEALKKIQSKFNGQRT